MARDVVPRLDRGIGREGGKGGDANDMIAADGVRDGDAGRVARLSDGRELKDGLGGMICRMQVKVSIMEYNVTLQIQRHSQLASHRRSD